GGLAGGRGRGEPVAYILGRKGFRHLELAVDRRVLVPRPETELLVEVALELQPRRVLDVGTRSAAVRPASGGGGESWTSAPARARSRWRWPTSCRWPRWSRRTPRPGRWRWRGRTPSA